MKTVYLAGQITTNNPASLEWREEAEAALRGQAHVVSPLRGKESLRAESPDGGITSSRTDSSSKAVILRDFHDVESADVILADLTQYDPTRPLVGTYMELAWAWYLKKPVVVIAAEDDYLARKHPFIVESVAAYFPTLDEAVACLRRYWL